VSKTSFYLSLFIVVLLVTIRGSSFLSQLSENTGLVFLGKALASPLHEAMEESTARAEALLRRATTFDAQNDSAWRGLGFTLETQGREEEAVFAWQTAGKMAQEFIRWGEWARGAESYPEALGQYKRALAVSPDLADPWYYSGLAYEAMEQWKQALAAYDQALQGSVSIGVGRSSIHYRKGVIYQWRLDPRQTETALAAYEAAIELDDFSNDRDAADCHYKRGEILRWTGAESDECIAAYRQALDLNPDHVAAHIYLGVAYYARYGDVALAEAEIRRALELGVQQQWAYYHLGEIYRQEGDTVRARAMYQQALEIDPAFAVARSRLESLSGDE
jgi:tetratricopeptide (TPR) repeat protein